MMLRVLMSGLLLLGAALAQVPVVEESGGPVKPVVQSGVQSGVQPSVSQQSASKSLLPRFSDAAKLAFGDAQQLEQDSRMASGPVRSRKLELAAMAFDRLITRFELEPKVAAQAAWSAAELWRRHGSVPLAERDYLVAARLHAFRYGQRALLAAGDMQRRQLRTEDAMKTYKKAEAVDPRTRRAQEARLWMARMLLVDGKVDRAIERFQGALESAPTPRQSIEAADYLAKAWIVKGDLESARFVVEHAAQVVDREQHGDPVVVGQLRRAFHRMGAKKALRRAFDEKNGAAKDAVRLDEHRRGKAGK